MKILVVGEKDLITSHFLYRLDSQEVSYDITNSDNFYFQEHYDMVVYMQDKFIIGSDAFNLQELFGNKLDLLQKIMTKVKTDHFIFIDFSYNSDYRNPFYQELSRIAKKLIPIYSRLLHKNYTIFCLYNIIGYKFQDFPLNFINDLLENKEKIILLDQYDQIHFTYIDDVISTIISSLYDKDRWNTTHHLRYDDIGTSLDEILDLYEEINSYQFKYRYVETNGKIAPYEGKPASFFQQRYEKEDWVKRRVVQKYY
jgi:hypothetical protein